MRMFNENARNTGHLQFENFGQVQHPTNSFEDSCIKFSIELSSLANFPQRSSYKEAFYKEKLCGTLFCNLNAPSVPVQMCECGC